MTKMFSISIGAEELNVLDQYVKNNSLNRSRFIVTTLLEKIKKSQTKGKK
jgi:metal-responsive CopG/Arc/MetJ family transcriptional regulator